MPKLTEEEKIIRQAEREALREAKEAEKAALKEANKKPEKTEQQLVEEYAKKVMDGKISRGHFDKRFDWHNRKAQGQTATNKDLWFDTDFFFSVVFQSEAQKYEFLNHLKEQYGLDFDDNLQIQIVNGLEFAKKMGLSLRPEIRLEYPYTDLEIRPLVLDSDEF